MPRLTNSELIEVAVTLMKTFPIISAILLCNIVIGIGIFIKHLMKEKNTKVRIKKASSALLLVIFFYIVLRWSPYFLS